MEKFRTVLNRKVYNPPLLRVISIVSIGYLLYYLWWRLTATLNPDVLVFSLFLLLAESFGVINYILFAWMTQDVSPPFPNKQPGKGIRVDVFVPTYNESLDILEATLIGCNGISYPHITYVLDDGKRPEVKHLASQLGCEYITRPNNQHAKAGNINHGLAHTYGEFIVVLDADMVPQPDFLDKTLGYFENQKLAFIQLPQEFYNEDSIQHDKKISQWHEQALFFRVIQPGKNHSGSVFWCGSPSIIRREALENVGGVATETITEDIHTSVRLHSKGWQSLFLNEVLAYGIAPQTIKAFLLQRLRWAQGTMQLYRSSESPLWIRGLTIKQRLSYLSSFLAYFGSFQKLFFILTPTIIILFNAFPMRVNVISFLIRWIPYFLFTMLANQVFGRGYFKYYLTEKFNLLKMIVFIQSTLTLFQKKSLTFFVTPKSVNSSVYKEERNALRVYMVIFGIITGIVLYGFWKLLFGKDSPFDLFNLLIALVWATYNSIIILMSIIEVFRKKHERKQYRFIIQEQAELINSMHPFTTKKVWIDNLSLTGAGLIIDKNVSKEDLQILRIQTPDHKYIFLPIGNIHYQKKKYFGKFDIGVSFADMPYIFRERLLKYLFVYLPRAGTRLKRFPLTWSSSALRRRVFEQPSVAIEAVNITEDNS